MSPKSTVTYKNQKDAKQIIKECYGNEYRMNTEKGPFNINETSYIKQENRLLFDKTISDSH